jgi:peptidyl-tRNA hydrolase, PTH1 family
MIKALIGLGNPGRQFYFTRHNIGFRVVDALAERFNAQWREAKDMELATIALDSHTILFIKPQTFMNSSGKVVPFLQQRGIKPEEVLVIHDELELPFGKVAFKKGGSAKGHNGLKSLIAAFGSDFDRVRCGIGRPEQKEQVGDYVLHTFSESPSSVDTMIEDAVRLTLEHLNQG